MKPDIVMHSNIKGGEAYRKYLALINSNKVGKEHQSNKWTILNSFISTTSCELCPSGDPSSSIYLIETV